MKRVILLIIGSLVLCACGGNGGSNPLPPVVPPADAATGVFLKSIVITTRTASSLSGVASVSCLSNENVVGGGAWCTGYATDNEAGYLFASNPAGNGYVAGCYSMAIQVYTPITVYANCAAGVYGNAVTPLALQSIEKVDTALAEAEARLLQMIEDHKARLN